jgi:hypothetical protein
VTAGDSSITIAGTGAAPTVKINAANANVFSATQKAPTWAMSNSGAITDDFGDIYFTTGSGGATRQSGTNWQLTSAGVLQFTAGNLFAAADTGISRLGAASIAFGNGTAGDKSATINYKQSNVTPGTITAGATPAITTASLQTITLNANATPTITIATGEHLTLQICQNGTGGFTWAWPASVHGGISSATIAAMAVSTCAVQSFDSFNGTTLVAENTGVTNVAP